ncbi:MAG TPA: hypothetical protein VGV62_14780 [Xanthobacteraceae bacterium]|jgi:hypothetical protein|nr:hypothetical protein [Xanthobacteraceae bacterium]
MRNRKPVINYTRVADGILFATHGDRCRYLGTLVRNRPQWLKDNPGSWRRIEDVQREAASTVPPVESQINVIAAPSGPNGQTSSHDVRKDSGEESVPSGSTQTELQPPAKAAMRETEGPKTETTALGAMGRRQGRGGGRKKQKRPSEPSKARRKRYERMRVVLECLRENPVQSGAARKAGIYRKTLAYWIKRSEAGDEGYDIEWQGWILRFHEHVESAIEEAIENMLAAAFEIAKGGVIYKYDEALLSLGFKGPDAYARDQNGNPIPEFIFKWRARARMIRFLLEWRDKYVNHPKIDIPQKSGIVFVSVPFLPRPSGPDAPPPAPPARERRPKKIENSSAASVKVRKWKS